MADIVNFYESKAVKKLQKPYDDKQYDKTGIKIDSRTLICGQTGAGKTNALMGFLALSSDTFAHCYICNKVDEVLYDVIREQLKGDVTFYLSVAEFPQCRDFDQQKDAKHPKKYLCIFDDCISDNSKKATEIINPFFTFGRKCHITLLFLSQNYYQTDKYVRTQLSNVILFAGFGSRDLNLILRDHCSSSVGKEDLESMYRYSTREPLNFFKITTGNCPKGRKFSHNFTDWFEEQEENDAQMDVV